MCGILRKLNGLMDDLFTTNTLKSYEANDVVSLKMSFSKDYYIKEIIGHVL